MNPARVSSVLAVLSALGLVALWVLLGVEGPGLVGSPGSGVPEVPLPDAAVPPVVLAVAIYSAIALAAAGAVVRGAPLVVVLCGGISLVPVGLYTLLLPFPFRLIGVLDLALVVTGVVLLRSNGGDATTGQSPAVTSAGAPDAPAPPGRSSPAE